MNRSVDSGMAQTVRFLGFVNLFFKHFIIAMKYNMKILIKTPFLNGKGGVSNFYRMLSKNFECDVELFVCGKRTNNIFMKIFFSSYDLLLFVLKLLFGQYSCVVLNPSLLPVCVLRDGVYSFIAKRVFRKKVYIFWHGWHGDYEKKLESRSMPKFRFFFFNVDGMFVLASPFRNKLMEWGYKNPIHLATTTVEDYYCELPRKYRKEPPFTLLYLSRVQVAKGIFLALETVRYLQKEKNVSIRFIVAGDNGAGKGNPLEEAKQYVKDHQLKDVTFTGYVRDNEKVDVIKYSDIFIFPSSYFEGMPCALLEAMASGLPIITSNVGGIPDIFQDGQMGFMLSSFDPVDYAQRILDLTQHPEMMKRMGTVAREYAKKNLCASTVAHRILQVIKQ